MPVCIDSYPGPTVKNKCPGIHYSYMHENYRNKVSNCIREQCYSHMPRSSMETVYGIVSAL